jgi:hypothetical protein
LDTITQKNSKLFRDRENRKHHLVLIGGSNYLIETWGGGAQLLHFYGFIEVKIV